MGDSYYRILRIQEGRQGHARTPFVQIDCEDSRGWVQAVDIEIKVDASDGLPAYQIFDMMIENQNMQTGLVTASLVIPTLSRKAESDHIQRIVSQIAKRHNLSNVSVYCTCDAYEADGNSFFKSKHPNAYKNGYLGKYENGIFRTPEKMLADTDAEIKSKELPELKPSR